MSGLQPGSASLPRGFRYEAPKTPEPMACDEEMRPPSPPRPRFRLKKRNASNLAAPTQQFLASVAAANVPIPSIEEPEQRGANSRMLDSYFAVVSEGESNMLSVSTSRGSSPPRTPAPDVIPSLSPSRYPNWSLDTGASSLESTPEWESPSRPSTSRSSQTSASLFSRFSQFSEDMHCFSPEPEETGQFCSSKAEDRHSDPKKQVRRAPWTKAMSTHLWSTYLLYLQDPKVTPFRMGKSCIPPHGVCLRVAREARRSWKGSKAVGNAPAAANDAKSGSSTPTADGRSTFMAWPHTCAATRAHLRELCKIKAASSGVRNRHYMSRSPTPFENKAASRHWNRHSTPLRCPSVFSTQDVAISLAISTSDTMQPHGPLAQLTSSALDDADGELSGETLEDQSSKAPHQSSADESQPDQRMLASPFVARSYGPSFSNSLAVSLGLTGGTRRRTQTIGTRRSLQSPVRLSRSSTLKRRTLQSHELRKRPVLSDFFTDLKSSEAKVDAAAQRETELNTASTSNQGGPSSSQHFPEPFSESSTRLLQNLSDPFAPTASSQVAPPPRLGSPFAGSSSFPNRFSQPIHFALSACRKPFATVQATDESNETGRPASTLENRLEYLDRRLREFRARDDPLRRSDSPH